LIRSALSGHIARKWGETASMEGKAKYIFPIVVTFIIVFLVSAVVTFLNIGLRADYVSQWLGSFVVAWPFAALVAFVAIPTARWVTRKVVALIEGTP
jgi:hypothetical protein